MGKNGAEHKRISVSPRKYFFEILGFFADKIVNINERSQQTVTCG